MHDQDGYSKTLTIILLIIVIGIFAYLLLSGELKVSFK